MPPFSTPLKTSEKGVSGTNGLKHFDCIENIEANLLLKLIINFAQNYLWWSSFLEQVHPY